MGRQIPVIATPEDERELLRFIQSLSPIRVFQTFASSREALWLDDWERADLPGHTFSVWLQAFPWEPTYGVTGGPGCAPERAGFHYFANANTAPVLEISRGDLAKQRAGRIYWGRNFSAPHGLTYEDAEFAKLVDQVWRWVRKHGRRVENPQLGTHYLLCHAWSQWSQPVEQIGSATIE
jgi:hypothetical protein